MKMIEMYPGEETDFEGAGGDDGPGVLAEVAAAEQLDDREHYSGKEQI